ncbi:hypothetical protein [uncultured Alistipes sp.]|uniref:hypothetical protein n=1 Tax=uncultured Alistipes sp. TaxID=538949 RepID=UPI00260005B0|nr:hypothetical protein [uncultured Alistipes sp.]
METIHGVRVNPYFFAGVGVDFSLGSKLGLYVKLSYQSQGIKDNYNETLVMYGPSNTGAIVAQVGFRF